MTLDEAIEVLERTARSQVCQLEPRDCGAIAKVIRSHHPSTPIVPMMCASEECSHLFRATDQGDGLCVHCGTPGAAP